MSNQETSSQRQNITYARSADRNLPTQTLPTYLNARAVSTKYAIMPIIDEKVKATVPLNQKSTYNPRTNFNPGNAFGPWSGFSSNINDESILRNQIYALQSCPQATYIPSSDSVLYKTQWTNTNKPQQPFPDLFNEQSFCQTNPNPDPANVGFALFNNSTRHQVKDLSNK